ncbi:MAG: DoxX family protein [Candidatus Colwellbacteria bacterium]|nr:DoxX family protein [Candidatus Colwellbacteria bacterium]
MIPVLFAWNGTALFLARVFLGILFLVHGWPKIKNLKTNASNFDGMGFRPGMFWGTIVALLEFFGGIALIFGFLVQPVALFIAIEMVVAGLWKISKNQPFVSGYELDFALAFLAFVLATSGGGIYAVDYLWPFLYF